MKNARIAWIAALGLAYGIICSAVAQNLGQYPYAFGTLGEGMVLLAIFVLTFDI